MNSDQTYAAKAAMLIRKPIEQVFDAFINPEITTKFWFTKSTGSLQKEKSVEWTWEMYNHTTPITVTSIIPNKKIKIEWGNRGQETTVEWIFESLDDSKTFVSITNHGFQGTNEEKIAIVRDSTEGFTLVLAGLKAYLEYNIELNLVGDRFPKGI